MKKIFFLAALLAGAARSTFAAGYPPYVGTDLWPSSATFFLSGNICLAKSTQSAGTCNINIDGVSGNLTGAFNLTNSTAGWANNLIGGAAKNIPFQGAINTTTFDATNFCWDGSNHRLGVGTCSPAVALDLNGGTIRQAVANCAGGLTTDSNGGITGCNNTSGGTNANNTWSAANTYVPTSSVTFNGGFNGWYDIPNANQDFLTACPSTWTWTLSNYLLPNEVATSSITSWGIDFLIVYSSNSWFPILSFGNDSLQHYGYSGSVGGAGYGSTSLNNYFGISLVNDNTSSVQTGAINILRGSIEFETILSSTTVTVGTYNVQSKNGSTTFQQNTAGFNWIGNSVLPSVQISGSTTGPSSSGSSNRNIPMCGHAWLRRKGYQHR